MLDSRVAKLAEVLTSYSLDLQPGDKLLVQASTAAAPLVRAVYRLALDRGALPVVSVRLPGLDEILLREGSDDQLRFIDPIETFRANEVDAALSIGAAENTRSLSGVSPERQQLMARSRSQLRRHFAERAAAGEMKWSSTIFPTAAHAQDADMSLSDYEAFVFRAEFLDDPDPVARWRELSAYQASLIEWLTPRKTVHVEGPDTDLRLEIGGRIWNNSDGHRNFPSGEVFTGPIEDSVNGHVRFSYSTIVQGRRVEDVRLWFEHGVVVKATAARNQEFLDSMLATDEGARRLGEFAFGTNRRIDRFTGSILFDEKMGGTIHMALGSGYPDTGSQNRSAIHWDLICDLRRGGQVTVDGEKFVKDGEYLVGRYPDALR